MKDKIAETALQEFLKHGIRDVTVAKLIAPLRISTKTFYKYFDSKEALLKECLHLLYNRTYKEVSRIAFSDADPVNKLVMIFRQALDKDFGINHAFYHDLNYYYFDLQNQAISHIRNESGTTIIPLVEQGIKEGYFLDSLNPLMALNGINTLYTSITRGKEYEGTIQDSHLLFENLVITYIRGMCTEKGRRQIENQLNY